MNWLIELFLPIVGIFSPEWVVEYRLNRMYEEALIEDARFNSMTVDERLHRIHLRRKRISVRKLGEMLGIDRPRTARGRIETGRRIRLEHGFTLEPSHNPKMVFIA